MKADVWDAVRPPTLDYHNLPELYAGDKAVLALVRPVVTVCKHYMMSAKTTIVTYDADTRRQPDVDKDPAEYGPQRPVCSHRMDNERPLQETHLDESNKGKDLVMVFVSEPLRIHPEKELRFHAVFL